MSDEWVNDYDKRLEEEAELDAQAEAELKERYPKCESSFISYYVAEAFSEYVTDLENYLLDISSERFDRCHCCQKVDHVDGMKKPTVDVGAYYFEADFWVCEDCI